MPIKLSIPYTFVQTANSSEVPLLFEEQWPWNIPKTKRCVGYFCWKFYPRVITLVCRGCEICSFFCLWVVICPFFFLFFWRFFRTACVLFWLSLKPWPRCLHMQSFRGHKRNTQLFWSYQCSVWQPSVRWCTQAFVTAKSSNLPII